MDLVNTATPFSNVAEMLIQQSKIQWLSTSVSEDGSHRTCDTYRVHVRLPWHVDEWRASNVDTLLQVSETAQ
jgi:hypothetical protein